MAEAIAPTAYDFDCVDLRGQALPLRQFAGRPLLIFNTASRCAFTPQYQAMEAIWQRYHSAGLVVIGVPSNDFGGQEPGDNQAIANFCAVNYNITFHLLSKTPVTGTGAHPLFQWLAREGGWMAQPHWNFYKYLIGRDGRLKDWYSSLTMPQSSRFTQAVARLVAKD